MRQDTLFPVANDIEPQIVSDSKVNPVHVGRGKGINERYTDSVYLEAARDVMGSIDLDPASCQLANENVKAAKYYTKNDNGLNFVWEGNIWMNPPYSGKIGKNDVVVLFCEKLVDDLDNGHAKQACVLLNNATETKYIQLMLKRSNAVCFPSTRCFFFTDPALLENPEDNKPTKGLQGQVIFYFGDKIEDFVKRFGQFGATFRVR